MKLHALMELTSEYEPCRGINDKIVARDGEAKAENRGNEGAETKQNAEEMIHHLESRPVLVQ